MDNANEASQAAARETSEPASGSSAGRRSPWPIRRPRSMADYLAGRWLPGRSAHGGDIPCQWIPPEYANRDEEPEQSESQPQRQG
jgi:hypothetical protein